MQTQSATTPIDVSQGGSPVDDITYDLLQTLTSKLEAIEVYGKYLKDVDDDETRRFFESCRQSDQQSAQQCLQLLKTRLTAS